MKILNKISPSLYCQLQIQQLLIVSSPLKSVTYPLLSASCNLQLFQNNINFPYEIISKQLLIFTCIPSAKFPYLKTLECYHKNKYFLYLT